MIFPVVRISQLSRDVQDKRAALDRSKVGLERAVKEKLSPLNIVKEHPQVFIGAAMSLFSAGKVGKILGLFGRAKNGHANGHSTNGKSGLIGTVLKFGGRTAVKTVMPLAVSALKYAFKSAYRSFKNRRP